MTNSKTSHKIKHRTNAKDKFYTPLDLAKDCIERVPFAKGDVVLDPALGKGVFYDNYPSYVIKKYCEIDLGFDFFNYENEVDWCVTNPPYSKLRDWLEKTCKISRKGFGYMMGVNNLTAKRIELCNKLGFGITKLHMFKIYKWYGMSIFVIFEREKENIITFNRVVWRNDNKTIYERNKITMDKFL